MTIWSPQSVESMFSQAKAYGDAKVRLTSAYDAHRFRHALCNYRRRRPELACFTVKCDEAEGLVTVEKRHEPQMEAVRSA